MRCLILSGTMPPQPIPLRVLVVDDDPMSRDLLVVLLTGEGYAAESADSGEAALVLLRQAAPAPDLVLADVQMPGTTGARLARQLRRACGPATLLLAMSGSKPPEQAISGFDGFLLKPFQMQEIEAAFTARKQAPDETTASPPDQEKWGVDSGPARTSQSNPRLVSIASSAPKSASKKDTEPHAHDPQSAKNVIASGSSGDSILNETIYQQLSSSMPAQQLFEMYTMCLDDARRRIAGMRTLAAAHDRVRLASEAHTIKGGCGFLGATELHRMAAELETSDTEPAPSEAHDVNSLDELSAACDRLERMLRSRV